MEHCHTKTAALTSVIRRDWQIRAIWSRFTPSMTRLDTFSFSVGSDLIMLAKVGNRLSPSHKWFDSEVVRDETPFTIKLKRAGEIGCGPFCTRRMCKAQRRPMAKMVASFLEEGNRDSLRAQKSSSSSIQTSPSASARLSSLLPSDVQETLFRRAVWITCRMTPLPKLSVALRWPLMWRVSKCNASHEGNILFTLENATQVLRIWTSCPRQ